MQAEATSLATTSPSYFRYFLMPRRPVQGAVWIVCYGCDIAEYDDAEVLWRGPEDTSIVRVRV